MHVRAVPACAAISSKRSCTVLQAIRFLATDEQRLFAGVCITGRSSNQRSMAWRAQRLPHNPGLCPLPCRTSTVSDGPNRRDPAMSSEPIRSVAGQRSRKAPMATSRISASSSVDLQKPRHLIGVQECGQFPGCLGRTYPRAALSGIRRRLTRKLRKLRMADSSRCRLRLLSPRDDGTRYDRGYVTWHLDLPKRIRREDRSIVSVARGRENN